MIRHIILLLIITGSVFPSCQQRSQQLKSESNEMMTSDSFHTMAVEIIPGFDNFSDVSLLLTNVNVSYYPELINSVENIERYLNNDLLQAANIGIYMVDLAYTYSFGDGNSAAGSYLSAITLAQNLPEVMTFLNDILSEFTISDLELDTILMRLEQDLQASVVQLKNDEEKRLYTALLTGNYIEKTFLLYTTISRYQVIPDSYNGQDENLQKLLWIALGQKKTLEELNRIIDHYAIPQEQLLCRDHLTDLEKHMNEAAFLSDTCMIPLTEIIPSPEFIALFDEIVKIRGLIAEPEE